MIEILQIIIQLFIFNILFLFPVTPYFASIVFKNINLNFFNLFTFNIVIQLLFYLIISFFNLNLNIVFYFCLLLSVTFLFLKFKYNIQFFKKNFNKLFLSFLIINFSLFSVVSSDPALGWDGVVHWINKAQAYFQELGFINTGIKEYPHLPGFLWGFFWKNSIIQKEYVGRLFLIFFYTTSIFYAANLFNSYIKNNTRVIFCFIIIFLSYERMLFGGYNDYYIFSLFIISSIFLYNISITVDKKLNFLYLLLFYTSSFLLSWIKQEGFFWFILLILVLILIQKTKKKKLIHLFNLFLLIIIFFSLKFLFYENTNFAYQVFDLKVLKSLLLSIEIFKIFIDISYYIIVAFLKYPIWIIIVFAFTIIGFEKNNFKVYKYFYLFLFFNIIFLYALMFHAYLVKVSLNELSTFYLVLRVSLDRIVLQSSGFFLPFVILILDKIFLKPNYKFLLKNRVY
jgi:hypothetical protein